MSLSRSTFYYEAKGESPENLRLMRRLDEQFLETPYYGSRQMVYHLRRQGYRVGRKRVRRLMAKMGLAVIYQKPRTSQPHPENPVYPYLLRRLAVSRPDQCVVCGCHLHPHASRVSLYLVAAMDWYSRRVLSWRLSNTLEPGLLRRGTRGGPQPLRCARDLQHGPGEPVHEPAVYEPAQRSRSSHLDGRQGALDGQHLHRASVAVTQVRMRLPERLRNRYGGSSGDRPLDSAIQ